ncbi:MAG: hypothetical protein Q8R78_02415 [Candidatus Omnitrophota bacterium]|nr:hypothetical protein [Candidatus Omnitrophota bacterium]
MRPLVTDPVSITLHIPCLPDLDLSANRRRSRHYYAQARDTATERERAAVMLREGGMGLSKALGFPSTDLEITGSLPWPAALHWTLYWPKGVRARDADGCADLLKPWLDAMKDLGWIRNDSPKYVRTVSYTSVPSSPAGPSMELVIEQAEVMPSKP